MLKPFFNEKYKFFYRKINLFIHYSLFIVIKKNIMGKSVNNFYNDMKEIQNMTEKIRRINENVVFEDEYDNEEYTDNENLNDNNDGAEINDSLEDTGMEELDKIGALDKIRLLCLDGMKELAKKGQPDSPQFIALNKIFNICNKGMENDDKNA